MLEVSGGTGRNLSYYQYNKDVTSLTVTDRSPEMLQCAQQKYLTRYRKNLPQTTFQLQDAENMTYEADSFDSVVDTFGLCACNNPVKALEEMARVTKPGGHILLLEHGRGDNSWINEILDKDAEHHAAGWGCWWNRDMSELLQQAGLSIIDMRKYHFGTTYFIVAQKNK